MFDSELINNDQIKFGNETQSIHKTKHHQVRKREKSYDIANRKSVTNSKNIGQFILQEKLGEGTFGVVRMGTHILTGEKVAVKILEKIKILEQADKTRVEREIKILKNLRHNNIIQLYSVIQTVTTIYLIMEYANGKELFDYIVLKKRLHESEACKFFQQILSGIEYLHKLRIVHRDLKPENLLLDNKKDIKIVDFGLSNTYGKNELLKTACGSPCYAAPEMIGGKKYSGVMVDIWSSGIILFAMICGYLPFEDSNSEVLYKKITEGKFSIPTYVSEPAKDIMKRILNTDPLKRYTIKQIKAHPWFNLVNPKVNTNEGLLININVIPIDLDLVKKMEEYDFKRDEVRVNILNNRHNHITTTYYLLLKNKLRKGLKSVADLNSSEFMNFINDPENLLSKYNNEINRVVDERAYSVKDLCKLEIGSSDRVELIPEIVTINTFNTENTNNSINIVNTLNINTGTNHDSITISEKSKMNIIEDLRNKKLKKFLLSNDQKENEISSTEKNHNVTKDSQSKTVKDFEIEDISNNYQANTHIITITDYMTVGAENTETIQLSNEKQSQFQVFEKIEHKRIEIDLYNKKEYLTNQNIEKKKVIATPIKRKEKDVNIDSSFTTALQSTILPSARPPLSKEHIAKNIIASEKIKNKIKDVYTKIQTIKEVKASIIMHPIKQRLNNKKISTNDKKNNFFNTSMSFDQNVDSKNTTFDQEIIKNLEKENENKLNESCKENLETKPVKVDKIDKLPHKHFGSRNKTESLDFNHPKTERNTSNNLAKITKHFDVIKEEDEFNKNKIKEYRGNGMIREIDSVKINNLSNESTLLNKRQEINTRYIPFSTSREVKSIPNADKSPSQLSARTHTSTSKTVNGAYSTINNKEFKSNSIKKSSIRHKKTISEPNVDKYLLSQFNNNLNLNNKMKNVKLLLTKPPINQNIFFKSKLGNDKVRDLSSIYHSNKPNYKQTYNTENEDWEKKQASASKQYFLDTNSSILKNRKHSMGNKTKIIDEFLIYKGPLDIFCISLKEPKKIKEDLTKILNSSKIIFKNVYNYLYGFTCDKNGLKFNVEINKLSDIDDGYYLKFKKVEGSTAMFKEISKHIMVKLNY